MNKTTRNVICALMGFLALVIISMCIYNISVNDQFWEFNLFNGITMLWTVVMSFAITQVFNRYQRKTDVLIKILQELLEDISEYKICNFSANTKREYILMQNRQIRQRINLLDKYAQKFGIKKEWDFIISKFNEYESIMSDNISDISYLSKLSVKLSRPIKLMREKIYEVILKV